MSKEHKLIYDLLKQSRYLKDISGEKIAKLASISHIHKVQKGEVLLHQGEHNQAVYLIVKGTVSVYLDGEFIYNLCRIGDIFGEMSVITKAPSSATITAEQDLDLVIVSSVILKDIQSSNDHELHSIMHQWFSNILSDKLNQTSQKAKLFETINRKLEADLEDAKSTQELIFSSCIQEIENLPLTTKYEFTDTLGGDLYAVFPVDETHYGILIGDVSGHGTSACLISMMMLNLFQSFSSGIRSPKALVNDINQMSLKFMDSSKFVTIFYCVYETTSGKITYTNAGHHSALVLRDNEVITLPASEGIVLGILDSSIVKFTEETFALQSGDRLILFTDAVFESLPLEGNITRFERIIDYIRTNYHLSSKDLIDHIYDYSVASISPTERDDFTLLIFEK